MFSGNLIDDYNSGAKVDKLAAAVLPGKTITRYRTDNDDCPTINSCSDKCGNEYRYSDWCEGKGTICTEWETIGPSGCSFTPTSDYISDLAELESELNNYIAYMGGYVNLNDGDYTISIMDSYLKNSNGKQYTYVFSDSTDPKLHKSVEEIGEDISSVSNAQIGSEGETISYVSSAMRGKIVHVSLPNSYTSIVKGEAYYKTDSKNNLKLYSANLKTGGFNKTVYSKYLYYPEEGQEDNVYFTSLLSPNFNVTVNDKMVYLKNESESTRSIKVDIQNIGSAVRTDKYSNDGFDKSVDCYYGVYNFMLTCTDPPCEEKEICEIELCDDPPCKEICYEEKPEGIEFIFRPIDLNDNFPNDRNPRWNWTSDAAVTDDTSSVYKLLDYKIDPTKLISNIESKNYSIYNDPAEIDYDITLTPELLNNIKKYNKNVEKNIGDVNGDGYYNYLDYDMTCGNDSYRHYCYSNFLDNPNYVKFNSTNRKDIAICNNTYNGACANLGGKS